MTKRAPDRQVRHRVGAEEPAPRGRGQASAREEQGVPDRALRAPGKSNEYNEIYG